MQILSHLSALCACYLYRGLKICQEVSWALQYRDPTTTFTVLLDAEGRNQGTQIVNTRFMSLKTLTLRSNYFELSTFVDHMVHNLLDIGKVSPNIKLLFNWQNKTFPQEYQQNAYSYGHQL